MIIIRTTYKPFGNNGIAWFYPFALVWLGAEQRTVGHERIHGRQWLEVWLAAASLAVLTGWLFPAIPLWALSAGVYASYWLVYAVLWFVTGRTYYAHPMEIDARGWEQRPTDRRRPLYNWMRYIL